MKKKLAVIGFIVILAAAIAIIIAVRQKTVSGNDTKVNSYETAEEAIAAASFAMDYPDRLCAYPATDFEANSSTIEITYGTSGFVRKTLGVTDNSGSKEAYPETSQQTLNGMEITFSGKDSVIYLATWTYNNFAYTISLEESTGGVDAEEMTTYIESTR